MHTLRPVLESHLRDASARVRALRPRDALGLIDALPAIAVVAILALVYQSDSYGEPLEQMKWLIGLLAVACVRVPARLSAPEPASSLAVRAAGVVLWLFLPLLLTDEPYQGRFILYPNRDAGMQGVVVLMKLAALWFMVVPPRPRVALAVMTAGGLAIRGFWFGVWEVHPGTRDMLPLTMSAGDRFLAGENPYGVHAMQVGSEIPLTYPPLLWLAYLPTVALDIDVRWTNWVADGLTALSLGLAAIHRAPRLGAWVLVGLAAFLFSPDVHWNGMYAEPNVDWAILSLWLAAILWGRWPAIGVATGLALLTRPFNVVLMPLLVIYLVRHHGLRTASRTLTVAGLIAAAGFLPFVLWDPDRFYFGAVHWLLEFGAAHEDWFYEMLGYTGPLYEADREDWMQRAQLLILATTTVLGLWRARTTHGFLWLATVTYAGFVAFNSLIWMSFWVSVALLATATAVATLDSPMPAERRVALNHGPRWLKATEAGLLAVVVLCGALLVYHLRAYFDTDGRDAVAETLQAELRPGDRVLDLSGRRLHFVETDDIVSTPPGVALSHHDVSTVVRPRRHDTPAGAAARVWVVDRHGEAGDDPFIAAAEAGDGMFEVALQETHGRYQLTRLDRLGEGQVVSQLSKTPAAWSGRLVSFDGTDVRTGSLAAGTPAKLSFAGAPDWVNFHRERCHVGGLVRSMLWAHPLNGYRLELDTPVPDGARYALVRAALDDRVVEWRRSDVWLDVTVDGQVRRELVVENAVGMDTTTIALGRDAQQLALGIEVEDDGRRQFCVDVVFYR